MPELSMRIFTTPEVAKLLHCTAQSVEIAARAGRLPGIQYGREWLFPEAALSEALRREALANLKTEQRPLPTPANEPALPEPAHAFTAAPSRRRAANNSRTRPRPDLVPLTG